MRVLFVRAFVALAAGIAVAGLLFPPAWGLLLVWGPLFLVGLYDMNQKQHAIRRNFPLLGHGRYLLEKIRPEINQYFIESNTDGKPYSREERSVIYQRAKGQLATVPFGTQRDLYAPGAEWLAHSLAPVHIDDEPRITIGAECEQPYSASLLNISAMSYGSLGDSSIKSLNMGAQAGRFAHNTGEGGISDHHLQGGDLIWQIGTGYFGCRTPSGLFDPEMFKDNANKSAVKMIEIKLSQGAKPGHGGILPAQKVTPEVARIRGVHMGSDVISPPSHAAFRTPIELLEFTAELRRLSGGKPVGFKLCIGKRREFMAIMKAILQTKLYPDYIAVDGAEGGTGAAPLEFSNSLGLPMTEGLIFAHNALVGSGLRDKVKLLVGGKIATGFDMARAIALGADGCYAGRAMMMALGCIQARRCNSNDCPAGVATTEKSLTVGVVVSAKAPRVARYHKETVRSCLDLIGASGVSRPEGMRPWHITRRINFAETRHYGELFPFLRPGDLTSENAPEAYAKAWSLADPYTFDSVSEYISRGLPVAG